MTQNMLFEDMSDGSEVKKADRRRRQKPSTSQVANTQHEASGKKRKHVEWVTDLVWKYPGHTPGELAVKAAAEGYEGLDYIELQRRVSECAEVRRGDKRRCSVKGTLASELVPGQ